MHTYLNVSYLNLLFNLSFQLLNLLCECLFGSGQLGDKSFFLFNLTAELTLCERCHDTLVFDIFLNNIHNIIQFKSFRYHFLSGDVLSVHLSH